MMSENEFIEAIEQFKRGFAAWKFTDPKKKKTLTRNRKKRLFSKPKNLEKYEQPYRKYL